MPTATQEDDPPPPPLHAILACADAVTLSLSRSQQPAGTPSPAAPPPTALGHRGGTDVEAFQRAMGMRPPLGCCSAAAGCRSSRIPSLPARAAAAASPPPPPTALPSKPPPRFSRGQPAWIADPPRGAGSACHTSGRGEGLRRLHPVDVAPGWETPRIGRASPLPSCSPPALPPASSGDSEAAEEGVEVRAARVFLPPEPPARKRHGERA